MAAITGISGLILAGGMGRRVQGRDKGLINWQGRPLVEHVSENLRPQVDKLYISCNRNQESYRALADALVADKRDDFQGPLAGIEAVSQELGSHYLVVVACDTPRLPKNLVEKLLAPLRSETGNRALIAYAHDGNREQYLCAAIHPKALASITDYLDSGQRTVRHWFQQYQTASVDFSDQSEAFENLNSLS